MKKRKYGSLLFAACLLMQVLLMTGCQSKAEPVTKTGFYFDTIIQITLYDTSKEPLLEQCFDMADRYEKLFSKTVENSDIYRINHSGGTPVTVEEETLTLLQTGLSYCEVSAGGFDITIGALSDLWNFKENTGSVPAQPDIDKALSTVSYKNVRIQGNDVTLTNPGTVLDLGAIAKGYIADQMKSFLNENGVQEGYINLGGNVLALGQKSDGSPYRIGIQRPFDEQGTPIATVEITDQTVVSSGVYERFFQSGGTLYHHILNPATGYPYQNGLLSVTIICQESVDGDALSTTCFSLGLEKGMALIESLQDTEAVFITEDEQLHLSSGMGKNIPIQEMNKEGNE